MFISGPWDDGGGREGRRRRFEDKYAVVPMPGKKTAGTSFVGGSDLVVFKNSENRDTAWKFVQWLTEPETQGSGTKRSTDLPSVSRPGRTRRSADDAKLAMFGEQLEDAKAPPAVADMGAGRRRRSTPDREGHQAARPTRPTAAEGRAAEAAVDRHRALT